MFFNRNSKFTQIFLNLLILYLPTTISMNFGINNTEDFRIIELRNIDKTLVKHIKIDGSKTTVTHDLSYSTLFKYLDFDKSFWFDFFRICDFTELSDDEMKDLYFCIEKVLKNNFDNDELDVKSKENNISDKKEGSDLENNRNDEMQNESVRSDLQEKNEIEGSEEKKNIEVKEKNETSEKNKEETEKNENLIHKRKEYSQIYLKGLETPLIREILIYKFLEKYPSICFSNIVITQRDYIQSEDESKIISTAYSLLNNIESITVIPESVSIISTKFKDGFNSTTKEITVFNSNGFKTVISTFIVDKIFLNEIEHKSENKKNSRFDYKLKVERKDLDIFDSISDYKINSIILDWLISHIKKRLESKNSDFGIKTVIYPFYNKNKDKNIIDFDKIKDINESKHEEIKDKQKKDSKSSFSSNIKHENNNKSEKKEIRFCNIQQVFLNIRDFYLAGKHTSELSMDVDLYNEKGEYTSQLQSIYLKLDNLYDIIDEYIEKECSIFKNKSYSHVISNGIFADKIIECIQEHDLKRKIIQKVEYSSNNDDRLARGAVYYKLKHFIFNDNRIYHHKEDADYKKILLKHNKNVNNEINEREKFNKMMKSEIESFEYVKDQNKVIEFKETISTNKKITDLSSIKLINILYTALKKENNENLMNITIIKKFVGDLERFLKEYKDKVVLWENEDVKKEYDNVKEWYDLNKIPELKKDSSNKREYIDQMNELNYKDYREKYNLVKRKCEEHENKLKKIAKEEEEEKKKKKIEEEKKKKEEEEEQKNKNKTKEEEENNKKEENKIKEDHDMKKKEDLDMKKKEDLGMKEKEDGSETKKPTQVPLNTDKMEIPTFDQSIEKIIKKDEESLDPLKEEEVKKAEREEYL